MARAELGADSEEIERMSVSRRPHEFLTYMREQDFHAVYLIAAENTTAIKVGVADDPVKRLNGLQAGNFALLNLHRFWWMAGRKVSLRVERAFKDHFAPKNIRGEWFNLPLSDAERFIEEKIAEMNAWGRSDQEMIARWKELRWNEVANVMGLTSPRPLA